MIEPDFKIITTNYAGTEFYLKIEKNSVKIFVEFDMDAAALYEFKFEYVKEFSGSNQGDNYNIAIIKISANKYTLVADEIISFISGSEITHVAVIGEYETLVATDEFNNIWFFPYNYCAVMKMKPGETIEEADNRYRITNIKFDEFTEFIGNVPITFRGLLQWSRVKCDTIKLYPGNVELKHQDFCDRVNEFCEDHHIFVVDLDY